jgi:hypothetical protein
VVETLLDNTADDLSGFSFVDFRSGKGRVLLMTSHRIVRSVR